MSAAGFGERMRADDLDEASSTEQAVVQSCDDVRPGPQSFGVAQPDALIGERIAERFTIVEPIARGGMGAVFKAVQAPMGRVCAFKVLSATYEGKNKPEFHRRFFREAATVARLAHPNTVTVYDYGNCGELYYIAMEYVGGRTLTQVMESDGPFPESRVRGIARQICRSLREAHEAGVIHRDLKPDNILIVERANEPDRVKVVDFGLAKVVQGDLEEDITETGLCLGSPSYMAPEQIEGGEISAHTDVYALGVLMYQMLTGHTPFEQTSRYQILMGHLHEAPPALRDALPGIKVSAYMERIVMGCLQKERPRRFASMQALLIALKGGKRSSVPSVPGPTSRPPIALGDTPHAAPAASLPPDVLATPSPVVRSTRPLSPAAHDAPPTSASPHDLDQPRPDRERPPVPCTPAGRRRWRFAIGAAAVSLLGGLALRDSTTSPRVAASALLVPPLTIDAPLDASSGSWPRPQATSEQRTDLSVVRVETQPSGARVKEQGVVLCAETPCAIPHGVGSGARVWSIARTGYATSLVQVLGTESGLDVVLVPLRPALVGASAEADEELLSDSTGYKLSPY